MDNLEHETEDMASAFGFVPKTTKDAGASGGVEGADGAGNSEEADKHAHASSKPKKQQEGEMDEHHALKALAEVSHNSSAVDDRSVSFLNVN